MAGAKMAGLYLLSIVVHGVALNITVQSYMGQLCFGLIACRRAVPDVQELATQLDRAMSGLRRLPLPETAAMGSLPAAAPVPAPAAPPAPAPARPPRGAAKRRKAAATGAPTAAVPARRPRRKPDTARPA